MATGPAIRWVWYNRSLICLLVFGGVFLTKCTSTLERPVQSPIVNLITPVNRLITVNTTQTFSWGAVAGTSYYELQVATPDFSSGGKLIFDTILGATSCNHQLPLGHFEWCLSVVGSSGTIYSDTNSLTVH